MADHIPPNKLIEGKGLLALEQPLQRLLLGLPPQWRGPMCVLALALPCTAHTVGAAGPRMFSSGMQRGPSHSVSATCCMASA